MVMTKADYVQMSLVLPKEMHARIKKLVPYGQTQEFCRMSLNACLTQLETTLNVKEAVK